MVLINYRRFREIGLKDLLPKKAYQKEIELTGHFVAWTHFRRCFRWNFKVEF